MHVAPSVAVWFAAVPNYNESAIKRNASAISLNEIVNIRLSLRLRCHGIIRCFAL